MRRRSQLLALTLLFLPVMFATASGLHPLGAKLPEGEIRFELKNAACANEQVLVECTYRPAREWDVRKKTYFHLFDWVFRIGSDRVTVQRDTSHEERLVVRAVGTTVTFTAPLRSPDAEHRRYQLDTIRINSRIRFGRWFQQPPTLDAGFGFQAAAETLRGDVRLGGLGALPLSGSLPLWPTLRNVELTIADAQPPTVVLWDPMYKRHSQGWRQTTPQFWAGGRTTVVRNIENSTVWRSHEYLAIQEADEAATARPATPSDVMSGLELEIFWPEGETLEFPDAKFSESTVIGLRVGRLTPRARELLARSVERRPGIEMNSLSAAEWSEIAELGEAGIAAPMEWAFEKDAAGESIVRVHRRAFTEPWIYLFGFKYDSDRRYAVHAMLLTTERWTGALPE